MIISRKWLSQYMDITDLTTEKIADQFTSAGFEIEGIAKQSQGSNLVIGHVDSCKEHPDSDHLHICQVDLGDRVEQIVCGAPNVAKGQKVIVAKVGAKLLGGEIKASVIRGQASNGMICSLLEVGVDAHQLSEESRNGIEVLDEKAPVGNCDPLSYLGLNDEILDIGLTPNRNDCLAAWSMALEAGAILHKEVRLPNVESSANMGRESKLKVVSETKKCSLCLGKVINNITIKASPTWMQELLRAVGIKSINNVVDISNIVMLETGQPLHFYDVQAVSPQEIIVKDGLCTTYTALDQVCYELEETDIVITNNAQPIGIAGIIGGEDSKIKETTRGIIIEVAAFDHVSIRNTSRRLNITTDASLRFQKGIEPMAPFKAMDRAVALLCEYADATDVEETVQYGSNAYMPIGFEIERSRINALLGTAFEEVHVLKVLEDLHLSPKKCGNAIHVDIPSYRTDLRIEEDIAEEIIRLLGYDNLPATMPFLPTTLGMLDKRQKLRRMYKTLLTSLGYNEAITYSLVNKQKIEDAIMPQKEVIALASPMSEEHMYVRDSILPSLLDSISYNQARSCKDIALFEISNVYGKGHVEERLAIAACGSLQKNRWQKFSVDVDFYTIKGLLMVLLEEYGIDEHHIILKENTMDKKHFHPYRSAQLYLGNELLGIFGQLHPNMANAYSISSCYVAELNLEVILKSKVNKIMYKEVSKFPCITRDLALLVKEDISSADVLQSIKKNGELKKEHIIQHIEVFDVYTGEHVQTGYKSIALSITFQSHDRTLKEEEVNTLYDQILVSLQNDVDAQLRS